MDVIVRCIDVKKKFQARRGYARLGGADIQALDGVSLEIRSGETLGIVGESGSGKTTLGKIILRLIEEDSGTVELNAERTQVIFQDPYNSLDPKMRVADILSEGFVVRHSRLRRWMCPVKIGFLLRSSSFGGQVGGQAYSVQRKGSDDRKRLEEALDMVRLPRSALAKYPHQFSGGERQRIAIARAVLSEPELIVCDEPVSSLDVTIQLQILRLLKEIQTRLSAAYLFISHDLRAVRFMADRIAVMKDGRVVEEGSASSVCFSPRHHYTKLLLASLPGLPVPSRPLP